MRCSNAAVLSKPDSCATPTARSITDGCIGKPKRSSWTRSGPTTGRTYSRATCGWLRRESRRKNGVPAPVISHVGNKKLLDFAASCFPMWLREDGLGNAGGTSRRPNLSAAAQRYLHRLGASVEDLFHHVLAVLHDPAYREANVGALRMDWPRIPLPGWPVPGSARHPRSRRRGRPRPIRPRAAANWPPCSTPIPPLPASLPAPCARTSPPLLFPPP